MSKVIPAEQIKQYSRDGVLFPIPVLSPAEVSFYRSALEDLLTHLGNQKMSAQVSQTHLFFRWAYDLATHPTILDAVEDMIGPNIIVHTSTIFRKHPQDPRHVTWHQDGHYWRLSAPCLISAWVALSASEAENGCMRVIPGSHKLGLLPHTHSGKSPKNLLRGGLEVSLEVDECQAQDIPLQPGQMSLHHLNAVHCSHANHSATERIGFVIRFAAPQVKQAIPHHPVVLARGRDEHHNFELTSGPPDCSIQEGIDEHARLDRWVRQIRLSRNG